MDTMENTSLNIPVLALRGLTIFPGCVLSFDVERDISIRALEREDAGRIPIIAMTANAFVEDIRLSREAAMNEHCSKPVDPERLQEILRSRFG